MPLDDRNRFLISVAKFIGKNPVKEHPFAGVSICETWLLDEIVSEIIPEKGKFYLGLERFNRLILNCGRGLATPHFYEYFFGGVRTVDEFERAVERYRIKAMWLFGNFEFAYKRIARSDENTFDSLITSTEPISVESYESRPPFVEIEPIPVEDLELLGYISSGELADLDFASKLIDTLHKDPTKAEQVLGAIGSEKQERLSDLLRKYGVTFPSSGTAGLSGPELAIIAAGISKRYEPLKRRQDRAIEIGTKNTHRYLTLPHLDVYVATSMRTHEDYLAQHAFISSVFNDSQVAALNLRFFDPTLSYVDDRISKGLVEMLMLQRAAVTIYNAGAEDTLGKDSELAATLAQGKAVIVYVPAEAEAVLPDGKKVDLNRRANTFRAGHPLGLQINIRTGVAHGLIVVRTPKECAHMLRKVILHERKLAIRHENGNFLLEETETRSVLRVVSDNPFLTHAFWTYFRHHAADSD